MRTGKSRSSLRPHGRPTQLEAPPRPRELRPRGRTGGPPKARKRDTMETLNGFRPGRWTEAKPGGARTLFMTMAYGCCVTAPSTGLVASWLGLWRRAPPLQPLHNPFRPRVNLLCTRRPSALTRENTSGTFAALCAGNAKPCCMSRAELQEIAEVCRWFHFPCSSTACSWTRNSTDRPDTPLFLGSRNKTHVLLA